VPEASAKLPQSSANSWAVQRLQARLAAGSDEAVQVARAARSILNKLTADKFEALYEQLVTCGVKTPEHVTILMQEIFEKATTQHNFIAMYADLCMRLEPDPRIAAAAAADGQSSFRRLLLNQCQCAFEELLDPTNSCDRQDDEEARIILKQKTLGNVKFVGQLIVRRMLSSRLLCDCTDQLLGSHEACPEALESVAALLRSACPTFDTPSWPFFHRLEQIFARLQELTVKKGVPSRIRFLLKDVLDLRKAGWPETPPNSTAPRAPAAAAPGPSVAPREAGGSPAAKKPKSGGQGGPAGPSPTAPPRRPSPRSPPLSPQRVAKDEEKEEEREEEAPPSSPAQATQEPAPPPRATEALAVAQEEKQEQPRQAPFSLVAFRRELSAILRDLGSDRNVGKAVKRVRQQGVPREHQAQQFADLLTRASEECRGPNRRSAFAFAAGLAAAAEQSAFNREECLAGTKEFFREVYPSLKEEVPRLPAIAAAEILPTLRSVLPVVQLSALVPEDLKNNAFTPEDLRSP
jgi:translation initiation factor 4G